MSSIQSKRMPAPLSMLVAVVLAAMALGTGPQSDAAVAGIVAALFASLAWALRGVNLSGAVAGGALAFVFYDKGGWQMFGVLLAVFVITLAATEIAALRKATSRVGGNGRTAAQVLANLIIPSCLLLIPSRGIAVIACAALAELAADTISSELGELLGGKTYLITNWSRVPSGANGGISLIGSLCGLAAATSVATAAFFLDVRGALWIPQVAGFAGMFVDSLLGATLENKHWLNNEAVNFLGTGSAAAIAWVLVRWNG